MAPQRAVRPRVRPTCRTTLPHAGVARRRAAPGAALPAHHAVGRADPTGHRPAGGRWAGAAVIPGLASAVTALAYAPAGPVRGLALAAACLAAGLAVDRAGRSRPPPDGEDAP